MLVMRTLAGRLISLFLVPSTPSGGAEPSLGRRARRVMRALKACTKMRAFECLVLAGLARTGGYGLRQLSLGCGSFPGQCSRAGLSSGGSLAVVSTKSFCGVPPPPIFPSSQLKAPEAWMTARSK